MAYAQCPKCKELFNTKGKQTSHWCDVANQPTYLKTITKNQYEARKRFKEKGI